MHVVPLLLLATTVGVFAKAAAPRDKRQLLTVPLYSACNDFVTCAAPSVCHLGRCACVQPYAIVGAACTISNFAAQAVDHHVYQQAIYTRPGTPFVDMAGRPLASPALQMPPSSAPQAPPPPPPIYRQVYADAPPPVPVAPRPQPVVYYPPVMAPTRIAAYDGTYIRESCLPPCAAVPAPIQPPLSPPPPPTRPPPPPPVPMEPPTTPGRQYEPGPNIGYPGDYCEIPRTVCVGGSICVNNVCVCRNGEEIAAGQCVRVEVTQLPVTAAPTTSTTTTTPRPTTTSTTTTTTPPAPTTTTSTTTTTTTPTTTTSTTTNTTPVPTTTVTEPTTNPPSTTSTTTSTTTTTTPLPTIPSTTTTTASTTSTTTTTPASTTTRMTTTTELLNTSTFVMSNPQEPSSTYRTPTCNTCCSPGTVMTRNGCVPGQIIRINLVPNMAPGSSCINSAQCTRGAYCSSGSCQCARRYSPQGLKCVLRK